MKKTPIALFAVLALSVASLLPAAAGSGGQLMALMADSPADSGTTDYSQDANCQGYWRMNDSGNESDDSAGSETLTETSGTIPTDATVPSGWGGTSRDCEQNDTEWFQAADGGSTDISGADQCMSMVMWAKFETIGNDTIMSKWQGAGTCQYYCLLWTGGAAGIQCGLSYDGTNYSAVTGGTSISTGTWYHIAFVYNDTDMRIYINGSLDSNGAENPKAYTAGIYNGPGVFKICDHTSNFYFDGLVDDLAIFDRELSAAEVSEIYNNGVDGSKGGND